MKVEKYPGEGSEIVPEIVSLQAVGELWQKLLASVMLDCVPFA